MYSRPQIPYVAAKLSAPTYAICHLDKRLNPNGVDYFIRFGQLPGHPIVVQITMDDTEIEEFEEGGKV